MNKAKLIGKKKNDLIKDEAKIDDGINNVSNSKKESKTSKTNKNLKGSMKKLFEEFPQITEIVPAMGYNDQQIKDMEDTLNKAEADIVIDGSPIDFEKLIKSNKPIIRVNYDIEAIESPTIEEVLDDFVKKHLK